MDPVLSKVEEVLRLGWCKNSGALDNCGNEVSDFSPVATKHCLLGALNLVLGSSKEWYRYYRALVRACDGSYPSYVNDNCENVDQVIEIVRRADAELRRNS